MPSANGNHIQPFIMQIVLGEKLKFAFQAYVVMPLLPSASMPLFIECKFFELSELQSFLPVCLMCMISGIDLIYPGQAKISIG
jgi:hypothetical protein